MLGTALFGAVPLAKTDFTDAQSGTVSNVITRATATLSGNSGGSFAGATVVATPSDSGLATGCYQCTLTGTNDLGRHGHRDERRRQGRPERADVHRGDDRRGAQSLLSLLTPAPPKSHAAAGERL